LHSNVIWTTILGVRKLQTFGYRWWRPYPFAFSRYGTIPECDGQTDRRTGGFAVAYTALAKSLIYGTVLYVNIYESYTL